MRPASNWARARVAIRRACSRLVDGQAEPLDRPRVPARRRQRTVAPQLGDLERPDDATRVAQVDRSRRASGRSRSGARRAPRRHRPRAPPRARALGRGRSAARPCRGRGRRRAGRARSRRRGSRRRPRPAIAASAGPACAAKSATLNGSSGSTRSRPWCGTRARSAALDLGRADVEAAEDLARIGRDDLGRPASAMSASASRDRQAGLAGRGRAGDDDERRCAARSRAWRRRPGAGSGEGSPERVRAGVVDADRRRATRAASPARSRWTSLLLAGPAGEVDAVGAGAAARRLGGPRRGRDVAAAGRSRRRGPRPSRPSHASVALEPDRLLEREERVEPAPLVGRPARRRRGASPACPGRGE